MDLAALETPPPPAKGGAARRAGLQARVEMTGAKKVEVEAKTNHKRKETKGKKAAKKRQRQRARARRNRRKRQRRTITPGMVRLHRRSVSWSASRERGLIGHIKNSCFR